MIRTMLRRSVTSGGHLSQPSATSSGYGIGAQPRNTFLGSGYTIFYARCSVLMIESLSVADSPAKFNTEQQ